MKGNTQGYLYSKKMSKPKFYDNLSSKINKSEALKDFLDKLFSLEMFRNASLIGGFFGLYVLISYIHHFPNLSITASLDSFYIILVLGFFGVVFSLASFSLLVIQWIMLFQTNSNIKNELLFGFSSLKQNDFFILTVWLLVIIGVPLIFFWNKYVAFTQLGQFLGFIIVPVLLSSSYALLFWRGNRLNKKINILYLVSILFFMLAIIFPLFFLVISEWVKNKSIFFQYCFLVVFTFLGASMSLLFFTNKKQYLNINTISASIIFILFFTIITNNNFQKNYLFSSNLIRLLHLGNKQDVAIYIRSNQSLQENNFIAKTNISAKIYKISGVDIVLITPETIFFKKHNGNDIFYLPKGNFLGIS